MNSRSEPIIARRREPTTGSLFAERVLSTAFVNLLLLAIGVATSAMSARLLGPEGRGELAAIHNVAGLACMFAMIGLPDAVTYLTSRNQSNAAVVLFTAGVVAEAAAVVVALLAGVLMPSLLGDQRAAIVASGRVYMLVVPLFIAASLPFNSLQGTLQVSLWNRLRLLSPVLYVLTLAAGWFLYYANVRVGAEQVLQLHIVMYIAYALIMAAITKRNIPKPYRFSAYTGRELIRYGIPSLFSAIPQQFNSRLDQLLMAAFVRPRALGLYAVAVSWSNAVPSLVSAAGHMALPVIAGVDGSESRGLAVGRILRTSVGVSCVLTIMWGAVTPFVFLYVMGESFKDAWVPLAILIPAAGIWAINGVLSQLLKGLGRPKDTMWVELAGLITTLLLLRLLLMPYQATGAAIASLGSYLTSFGLAVFLLTRATAVPAARLLIPKREDRAVVWRLLLKVINRAR